MVEAVLQRACSSVLQLCNRPVGGQLECDVSILGHFGVSFLVNSGLRVVVTHARTQTHALAHTQRQRPTGLVPPDGLVSSSMCVSAMVSFSFHLLCVCLRVCASDCA